MKLPSALTTVAALFVLAVSALAANDSTPEPKDPPPYPGQPRINAALKNLTAAQTQAAKDPKAALASLEKASNALAHAAHNKGTYQNIARELAGQATQHLEKGETDIALHKIDEAIKAANRGGTVGEH